MVLFWGKEKLEKVVHLGKILTQRSKYWWSRRVFRSRCLNQVS